MSQSESIGNLATALSAAQGKITGALKDSENPFFKSKYADLASVWDACRTALSENGLAVIQTTTAEDTLRTILVHKSGEWIEGYLKIKAKDESPQAQGSGLTYARRYALAAIVGIAQVDDDANAAQGHTRISPKDGIDTASVDPAKAVAFATRFKDALYKADNNAVWKLQDELGTQTEVYTATWNLLSAKQRADLRQIIQARPK